MKHSRFESKTVMVLTAVLCCVAWGSTLPVIKLSYGMLGITGEYEKILLGGLRYMLAGMGVLVFTWLQTRKNILPERKAVPLILLIALLQTFVGMTMGYIGISYTTGVKSSILTSTSVFMVALLAHFMFKDDRLTWRKLIGLVLGFAGVVIVNVSLLGGEDATFRLIGEGLILVFVATGALTAVLVRKYGGRFDMRKVNGWQLLLGGIGMTITGFAGHPQMLNFDIVSGALFVYLAAVSGICFTLWFILHKYHNASLLAQYKFIIPISGSLISVLLLPGEYIGIEMLIAVVLVSAGTAIVSRQSRADTQIV